jgi:thiamine-phosphate pyrophosphorylase
VIRLYLITPPEGDPAPAVRAALAALPRGAAGVQLRQHLPARALLERARALKEFCTKFEAPLLVNDRADVALASGADGVHLPAHGLSARDARALGLRLVGESVHSPEEAARSEADFCVFAPVFDTPGKTAQGVERLAETCRATRLPVFALGGVDPGNASRCIDAGARGAACIRAVLGARDPAAAAIALWKAVAVVVALLFAALPARADDSRYQDYPVGSRATALGGAFVALSDDPSGLYYNPAGICDARRLNVNVSASLYGFERQSRGAITLDRGTFSLAGLNQLNVIPGEAGLIKGVGDLDERGTPFAYGFDVTVPQFRSYGVDATDPFQVHNRVMDRTFNVAAGAGMRFDDKLNVGFALHYVLRLYETSEDALSLTGAPAEPTVGVYHASASFANANLVGLLGAKYRYSPEWSFGAALGLPGIPLHSAGTVSVQDVIGDPTAPPGSRTHATIITSQVNSRTFVPALLRLGAAFIRPHRWTLTAQATGHLGTSYDRFSVGPPIEQRLPTGIVDPNGFRSAGVKQLFFYFFLASTFRY